MSNFGEERITVEEVKPLMGFCEWLKQEWKNGLQGMDVDLNNVTPDEALRILKSIRLEWRLNFGD
jgi:hypothetical protein